MKHKRFLAMPDWLQLMADGGEGGAATGDNGQVAAGEQQAEAAPDLDAEFDALVKGDGKFREVFGKRMQKAALERTKSMKAAVDQLNGLGPALEVMAARYGMTADDPRLAQTIAQDASLLEDMALKNGRDTATEMELAKARAQTQKANELIRRMLADQDMQKWQADAAEMAAEFPDFNLTEELANPQFKQLLKNNVTMKGAYMALHPDAVSQQIVRRTEKKVTDTVAAGASRPRENGMGSQASAALGKDPAQFTSAQMRDYMKRIERGERIDFSSG